MGIERWVEFVEWDRIAVGMGWDGIMGWGGREGRSCYSVGRHGARIGRKGGGSKEGMDY